MPMVRPGRNDHSGVSATDAGLLRAVCLEPRRERRIVGRQDRGREQAGIDRARLADRQRSDRHAGRHLDDRQQAIHALERLALDRHAEHGQAGHRCRHSRQVRRPAGTGDDHLQPALLRRWA